MNDFIYTGNVVNESSEISKFRDGIPSGYELKFGLWVLSVVYGWSPEKVRNFKLSTFRHWMKKARSRLTVGNALAVGVFFKRRERRPLWKRLLRLKE